MQLALSSPRARPELDAVVQRVRDGASTWAALPVHEKADTARRMLDGLGRIAARTVEAACAAKRVRCGSRVEAEEWLSGPYVQLRILRQTIAALEQIHRCGTTDVGKTARTSDGRVKEKVFPTSLADAVAFAGMRGEVHYASGVSHEQAEGSRARFYSRPDHDGRVCLVLGGGVVDAIPVADVVTRLFNEGTACVLALHPMNAYLAPLLREAFADAIARGFVAVLEGGAAEGAELAHHPGVDEVHLTGSVQTHDALVWGPPGLERLQRIARHAPLLTKRITSQLGNAGPILIVPGPYTASDFAFQAAAIAASFAANASLTCATPRVLLTPKAWHGRDLLLSALEDALDDIPPRYPFHAGADDAREELLTGRGGYHESPPGDAGTLPWTLVAELDEADAYDRAFSREFLCPVLCEVPVGSPDPVDFLAEAVAFANDRLWGTLHASVVVHPNTSADPVLAAAVESAIERLRYGTVCVNTWPGVAFGLGVMPWGGYPGATLDDVQSGIGFVHNTRMLEHVEKTVMRSAFRPMLKPPWFSDHRAALRVARRLTRLERTGSRLELPALAAMELRG